MDHQARQDLQAPWYDEKQHYKLHKEKKNLKKYFNILWLLKIINHFLKSNTLKSNTCLT